MTSVRLRRMPAIDGLRAIAVAAVLVYHAHRGLLPGGFLGVDVFFVISGYLITSLLLVELERTGRIALRAFWIRRARRLLPALFVLLGACLLVAATVERGKIDLRGDALAAIFYVANWRFAAEHESYFAQFGRPPLLRHLWSLAVEEQFYVLWPLLLVLGLRLRRRFPLALPVLVASAAVASTAWMWVLYRPGADPSRVFYGTDTRSGPLLVGVLLAFFWKPGSLPALSARRARRLLDVASAAALACVVYAFAAVRDDETRLYHGGFLLIALCAAVLLAAIAHPQGVLGRALARPLLRWVGERSYGIYLWHWPVLCFTRPGVDVHLPAAAVFALQVAITLALADLSYRYVESPIRRGALGRLRIHAPRTPIAVTGISIAALAGLAAATPGASLPPGFTHAALAQSRRASAHLVALPQQQRSSSRVAIPQSGPILAVGDSVMLGAESALASALGRGLHVDAVVSRQPRSTIDRLLAYRAHDKLPPRVVVHVGDNGPVYYADWQRLKAALAGVPLVVLVNVRVDRSWQGEVNREMRQAVAGWRHATIADWYDTSSAAGSVVDGTHTSPQGARRFAAVIARALRDPDLGGVTR